jgi:MFS family permease
MRDETAFGIRPEIGRWGFVLLGVTMNLCLGAVYAWSIFKPAVEKVFDVTAFQGNLPFMTFIACFSVTMFFGGTLMERIGPRWTALLGGLVVGLGWLLSSLATSIGMLVLTYGVIAGSGVGLAYGCPVALGARWFPDRKGLAVGLMLAGFGGSAVLTGRIAHFLIGDVKTLSAEALAGKLSQTFLWFGMAFTVLLVLLALTFRFPTPGWKPQGWASAAGSTASLSFDRTAMVRTSTFWGLFFCYVIGCLSGLMAIGISKPVGSEIVHVSSATGSALVGLFALFNALGRPLFGWLADRITPRWAAVLNLAILLSEQAKDIFGSYVYAFYPTAGLAALGIVIALVLLKPPAPQD